MLGLPLIVLIQVLLERSAATTGRKRGRSRARTSVRIKTVPAPPTLSTHPKHPESARRPQEAAVARSTTPTNYRPHHDTRRSRPAYVPRKQHKKKKNNVTTMTQLYHGPTNNVHPCSSVLLALRMPRACIEPFTGIDRLQTRLFLSIKWRFSQHLAKTARVSWSRALWFKTESAT